MIAHTKGERYEKCNIHELLCSTYLIPIFNMPYVRSIIYFKCIIYVLHHPPFLPVLWPPFLYLYANNRLANPNDGRIKTSNVCQPPNQGVETYEQNC